MNEIVQKLVIENSNTGDHKFEQLVQALIEEDRTLIQKLGFMNFRKRQEIEWTLQNYIENVMYKESNYDEIEVIADAVMKQWNAQQQFQLSGNVVEAYIIRQFKSINHRKAYGEICESDIDSYKLFVNDSSLLAQYVLRQLFTYDRIQTKHIYTIFDWFISAYFNEDTEATYLKTLNALRLTGKRNPAQLIVAKAYEQGSIAKKMEVPFIKAIEKLYIEQFEKANRKKVPAVVVNFMEKAVYKKPASEQPKEVKQPTPQVEPTPQVAATEQLAATTEHEMIDEMITKLQQLKKTIEKPVVVESSSDQKLKLAEEEIMRLRQTIQSQETKLSETKDQTYTQLIETIGGSRSNYLLSDLYKESLGESNLSKEVIQGQLLNLFNTLGSLMHLEPITNGYDIDEEFDCDRSILAHQFRILNSISSEQEMVRVKLLQYGWSVNGKVIVQPQVVEMKEVH